MKTVSFKKITKLIVISLLTFISFIGPGQAGASDSDFQHPSKVFHGNWKEGLAEARQWLDESRPVEDGVYKDLGIAASDQHTQQLISDLVELLANYEKLMIRTQELDEILISAQAKLELPETVHKDLETVDGYFTTTSTLLSAAEFFEQIKPVAASFKEVIDNGEKPVKSATDKAKNVEKKTAPLKEKVEKIEAYVSDIKIGEAQMIDILKNYIYRLDQAVNCINAQTDQDSKRRLQGLLDKHAFAADAAVKGLNQAIGLALIDFDKKIVIAELQRLKKGIFDEYVYLDDIDTGIGALNAKLIKIESPLRDIQSYIDSSVSVNLPYPKPTVENPFNMAQYPIRIGVKIILDGAQAIQKRIEDLLSAAMYKVAKVFGLDRLIKFFQDEVENQVKIMTKELHLDFEVGIPGLDKLPNFNIKPFEDFTNAVTGFAVPLDSLKVNLTLETGDLFKHMNEIDVYAKQIFGNIYTPCLSKSTLKAGDKIKIKMIGGKNDPNYFQADLSAEGYDPVYITKSPNAHGISYIVEKPEAADSFIVHGSLIQIKNTESKTPGYLRYRLGSDNQPSGDFRTNGTQDHPWARFYIYKKGGKKGDSIKRGDFVHFKLIATPSGKSPDAYMAIGWSGPKNTYFPTGIFGVKDMEGLGSRYKFQIE